MEDRRTYSTGVQIVLGLLVLAALVAGVVFSIQSLRHSHKTKQVAKSTSSQNSPKQTSPSTSKTNPSPSPSPTSTPAPSSATNPTSPTQLTNTGPGNVITVFIATTLSGVVTYQMYYRRKLKRQIP